MKKSALLPDDPIVREYKLTPMFTSIRTALMVLVLFYIAAVLFVTMSGAEAAISAGVLCCAVIPVLVYFFAYVSPLKNYKKFVCGMTEEDYTSFLKKFLEGKKYITERPGDKYILTITDEHVILAQNPVTVIKMSDIAWIYQREYETPEKTYSFIDMHTKNKAFYTFTLENMSDEKAEEIIALVKNANREVKTGADAGE